MITFEQYFFERATHNDYISPRDGTFVERKALRDLTPIVHDANILLKQQNRITPEEITQRAKQILLQFVDKYDKLGDESTDLKAKIADKYTEIKTLLQSQQQPVEEYVQLLHDLSNILQD